MGEVSQPLGTTGAAGIRLTGAHRRQPGPNPHRANELSIRIAGACGLASVLLMIPSYVAGIPNDLTETADLSSNHEFLAGNTSSLLLHFAAALVFFAGITGAMYIAAGPTVPVLAALGSGGSFLTLTAAGYATQIAIVTVVHNHPGITPHVTLIAYSTVAWLYRFAMIGGGVLIISVSYTVVTTRILPRWWGAGCGLGLLPLFFTWIPTAASIGMISWVSITSLLLIAAVNRHVLTPR